MKVSKTIAIDREVWAAIQKLAQPLTDTPNKVLRRVLKLDEKAEATRLG